MTAQRKRRVQVGSGLVEVGAPKVTDALLPFASEVLPAWERRGEALEEAIVQLYAEGFSTRDFQRALGRLWGDCSKRSRPSPRPTASLSPTACGILAKDLADCLTFYRFPEMPSKRLHTSNIIERAFREVRRRTNVVSRLPGETAALTLIWANLEQDRPKWRGVRMDEDILNAIAELGKEAFEELDLSALDAYREAA
jgi:transposase-like protein